MHRCYLPSAGHLGDWFTLDGREAHHLLRVLRVRRGESLTVLDGAGGEFLCSVEDSRRDTLGLRVLERKLHPPPACRVTLYQALPKGKLFESILQKAVELGVSRVAPMLTERVVPQFGDAKAGAKTDHWRAVAVEAIKQCGNPWLPMVEAPAPLATALQQSEPAELSLVGALHADARHPRQWFQEFAARRKRPPASIGVWIGPEGDFTPGELDAVRAAGARPMSLGPRVLRVETAAIYALSIVNYELSAVTC